MPTMPQQISNINQGVTPQTIPFGANPIAPIPQASAPQTIPFGAKPIAKIPNQSSISDITEPIKNDANMFGEAASSYIPNLVDTYKNSVPDFLKAAGSGTTKAGDLDPLTGKPINSFEANLANVETGAYRGGMSLLNTIFAPISQAVSSLSQAAENNPNIQKLANDTGIGNVLSNAGKLINDWIDKNPDAAQALQLVPMVLGEGVLEKPSSEIKPKTFIDESVKPQTSEIKITEPQTLTPAQQETIKGRAAGLQQVADRHASVSNAIERATNKGFSPLEDIASDDRFMPSVDNNGNIDSEMAIKNLNDYIKPIAQVERQLIEKEGKAVSFDEFNKNVRDELSGRNLKERGASYKTIASRVKADLEVYKEEFGSTGTIDLTKLDDIKNTKYSIANWNNEDAQIADKIVARAARQTVVDNVKGGDVDKLNKVMSQYYSARDVLDSLNNKKVVGGRLGKYTARVIGSLVGSHFGPLGTIGGAYAGDFLEGLVLKHKLNPIGSVKTGIGVPDILKETEKAVSQKPALLNSSNQRKISVKSLGSDEGSLLRNPSQSSKVLPEPQSKLSESKSQPNNTLKRNKKQGGYVNFDRMIEDFLLGDKVPSWLKKK